MSILSARSRSSRFLRVFLTGVLALSGSFISMSVAKAAPAAPVITSVTTQTSGATQQVTVNFNYGDASTVNGFKYSTDGGSTWDECDTSKCNWTSRNTYLIIQKESGGTASMSNGMRVNIVIQACGSGTANNAGTGLSNCSGNSRTISYTVGVTSTPSISTSSTIANGATNPSITITSTNFETTTSLSLFTISVGTTGLTASTATWNSATSVTFAFTGTAAAGTVSIQASLSAFAPTTTTASNTVSVVVAATVPGAPTSVTGSVASSSQVNLSWTAPTSNGGASISDYLVQYTSDNGATYETFTASASTSTSRNITGLTAATTYKFRVAAKNSVGYGDFSTLSSGYTTSSGPTVPETPTAVTTGSATPTTIALSWTAPSSDGGSAITGYAIQKSSDGGSTWDTFTVTNTTSISISVTGLSNSTTYKFRVAAKNTIGQGPFSVAPYASASTTAAPTVPETPTAVTASGATSSSLSVSWTAPSDGGAAIDAYQLEKSTDGITWTLVSSTATSPYSVSGLSASTSYVFKVRAHNSVGWGPFSDSSTAVSTSATSSSPTPEPEKIYPPTIDSLSKLKVCARGHDEFIIRGNNFKNAVVTVDGVVVTIKGKSDGIINLSFGEATEGKKKITITNSVGSVTAEVEFKMVDKTAFKVFDIPYIYKGGTFLYKFEAFGENTFRVTGNMPAGLVLNAETGEISGIPTEEGKFNFVLHADGLCGNDVDLIKLDIDKEIPNAISHRIKFPNKKSKKITGSAQFELKKFLEHIKEISPKQIEPIIYITGGSPEDEADVDSQSAKDRRDSLCDIMLTQEVLGQTMLGLFDGEEDEIEIFVYWPVVR